MSISDIFGSSMYILSTWPIYNDGAVYAIGNLTTCNIQGTLDQFASLTTPLFSGSLAIYYLLVIKYNWREDTVRKYQLWFYIIPLSLGLSTSIAGIYMELYNSADWVCWIAPYPPGCDDSSEESMNPCIRGKNADLYRMVFSYAIVWIVFGVLDSNYKVTNVTRTSFTHDIAQGDIVQFQLNLDDNELSVLVDGVSKGKIYDITANTEYTPAVCLYSTSSATINFGQDGTFGGTETAGGNSDGNGIGNFKYSVPSGYLALCTKNLGS